MGFNSVFKGLISLPSLVLDPVHNTLKDQVFPLEDLNLQAALLMVTLLNHSWEISLNLTNCMPF